MGKRRAFIFSFVLALLVQVPVYLCMYAWNLTTAKPAGVAQSGIAILQPAAEDARTVLVMTGSGTAQTPDTYALVRFDAYQSKMNVVSFPADSIVLAAGSPKTLADAVSKAGPAQGVAALEKTLGIVIDHYLFASPETLCNITAGFGNAQLKLANYVNAKTISALQLDIEGVSSLMFTPQLMAQMLASEEVAPDAKITLRAAGYLAFLRANVPQLSQILPLSIRRNNTKLATNITALNSYDYERILKFMAESELTCESATLSGNNAHTGYEFTEEAVTIAHRLLE